MLSDCSSHCKLVFVGVAGLWLSGCNPATRGWSLDNGQNVSAARLIAAKNHCGYQKARRRAIRWLYAKGDRQKNEQHAALLLGEAERCMARKYGVLYHAGAYGIGQRLAE